MRINSNFVQAIFTLCNPGEAFLADEWTYPSATATAIPLGVHCVGVGMDEQGMTPEALEEVLSGWNEAERGFKQPHVMYLVPVGQNPCGLVRIFNSFHVIILWNLPDNARRAQESDLRLMCQV